MVGNYLLKDLMLKGFRVAVVARANRKLSATQRVEGIMQRWEKELGKVLPRPVVFEGDVNSERLGLTLEQQTWVQNHCDTVLHNAAVLQFHGDDLNEEPWRTNLGGTQKTVELAQQCGLLNFHYVSTAYVCGMREQTVLENELDCGQAFRNAYEKSKYQSELFVQQAQGFDSKTIYRPAVIVGDSKTGYTSTYHGLFMYLRLLATLVPAQEKDEHGKFVTPIKVPISGDEPRNLVPVDWVSEVICKLFSNPNSHGRVFHLVPDVTSTARELIGACCAYFNSDGVVFGGADDRTPDNEFAANFFDNAKIYESYEESDPSFDNQNLKQFAGELPCPPIDQEMVFRFMDFGIADNWGKKRTPSPEVACWFSEQLPSVTVSVEQLRQTLLNGSDSMKLGLDVQGPGGGQYQLSLDSENISIHPGLPNGESMTLAIENSKLGQALKTKEAQQEFWANQFESILKRECLN